MHQASEHLLKDLESRTTAGQDGLAQWSENLRLQLVALTDRIATSLKQADAHLASVNQEYNGNLRQFSESVGEHARSLQGVLEQQARLRTAPCRPDDRHRRAEQADPCERRGARAVTQTNTAVVENQAVLQSALRELREADLPRAFSDVVRAMSAQGREVGDLIQAIHQLSDLTSQITASQATLQAATKDLHDAGFGETLAAFRGSLSSLATVLDGFRKPFVLQAVALAAEGPDGRLGQRSDRDVVPPLSTPR